MTQLELNQQAFELWQRWFQEDGNPLCASECGGDLHCFFCGGFAVTPEEQEHTAGCIYVRAKAVAAPDTITQREASQLFKKAVVKHLMTDGPFEVAERRLPDDPNK